MSVRTQPGQTALIMGLIMVPSAPPVLMRESFRPHSRARICVSAFRAALETL